MLTDREKEILVLICEGLSSRQMGDRLNRSEHTVKSYVRSILQKWNVSNRVQIIHEAIHHELIQ